MERSSSQRDLRAERLARTPYSRPAATATAGSSKKSTSQSPFASLKSLVSYVASPFTRSSSLLPTHADQLDIAVDQDQDRRSESGSEDGWNGAPPALMEGSDVFTLASAAGRQGDDFDARAATWRAKGEKPGGRRQTARMALEAASSSEVIPPTPIVPGHFIRPSPSMPSLMPGSSLSSTAGARKPPAIEDVQPEASSSSSPALKRTRSPPTTNGALPFRPPLPSFMPPSTPNASVSSASSAALSAFLEAKKGQQMTVEDFRVIETLTDNMKTESHVGSPQKDDKVGGWAAGSYPSSIRHSQSLANLSTPAKSAGALLTTPGPVFSVGLNLAPGGGGKSSPYRQRYLGPGMSPRRIFPQSKKSGLQPLIQFEDSPEEGESAKKKRKVLEPSGYEGDVETPLASPSNPTSADPTPPAAQQSLHTSPLAKGKAKLSLSTHTPARPSPLSQSVSTPSVKGDAASERQASIEATGRKRAAQIVRELIEQDIGPLQPTRKTESIIFNPYDRTSLTPVAQPAPAVPSSVPSTAFAGSTPRKSNLNAQSPARRTPLRGAAAKLEAHKEMMKSARPLTTVERIKGVQPWQVAGGSSASEPEDSTSPVGATFSGADSADAAEIDEIMDGDGEESVPPTPLTPLLPISKAKTQTKKDVDIPSSSASAKIPAAETFKPFEPPSVSFSSSPLPKPSSLASSNSTTPFSFESKTTESILAASKANAKPTTLPTFSISKPQQEAPEPTETFSSKSTTSTEATKADGSIYLSAKDSALKVAKPALPFYTFTLPKSDQTKDNAAKDAATAVEQDEIPTFVFTLTPASDDGSRPASPGPADAEWTCDTCMLKNPATATEKCTICDAAKPDTKATASAPVFNTFSFASKPTTSSAAGTGAGSGSEWTCDTCMLKNPASATAKCTICDAAKPSAKSAAQAPISNPFSFAAAPSTNASAPTGAGSEWTCDTCMLKNPASATEKCTICDAAKPAAKAVAAPATAPGGFASGSGLGQKPPQAAAAGQAGKESGGDAEWTCSLCMLKNPGSAKSKCTICDAPRP